MSNTGKQMLSEIIPLIDKKAYFDRIELMRRLVEGKKVLDCGAADHNPTTEKEEKWLHKQIMRSARSVLGVDIEKDAVDELRKLGYNIVWGDCEKLDLKETFEVIVAGELLEHLSNPGMFLESMKKHMTKESSLVLSTPNATSLTRFYHVVSHYVMPDHEQHTALFDSITLLQLLKRHGFQVVSIKYFDEPPASTPKKILLPFFKLVYAFRSSFAKRMLVVARRQS